MSRIMLLCWMWHFDVTLHIPYIQSCPFSISKALMMKLLVMLFRMIINYPRRLRRILKLIMKWLGFRGNFRTKWVLPHFFSIAAQDFQGFNVLRRIGTCLFIILIVNYYIISSSAFRYNWCWLINLNIWEKETMKHIDFRDLFWKVTNHVNLL